MITLILDTSTPKSLVAFAEGERVLLKELLPAGGRSSSVLMKIIEEGFKHLHLEPSDLEAIAVAQGPGSYTGMRVGAAAAKGLAFPRALPLIGFCTLEGFIAEGDGLFASLIDARIGGSYLLLQKRLGNEIDLLSEPQLIPNEKLECFLENYPTRVGPHMCYPDPDHLARLAAQRLKNGLFSRDLELLYLRTPEYQRNDKTSDE